MSSHTCTKSVGSHVGHRRFIHVQAPYGFFFFPMIFFILKRACIRPEKAINNITYRFMYKLFNLRRYVPRNPELCVCVYMQSLCRRLVLRIKQFRYVVCVINALKHPQQLSAEGRLLNAVNITVCLFGGRHTALVHSLLSPIKLRCLPDIVSFFFFFFFCCPPPSHRCTVWTDEI